MKVKESERKEKNSSKERNEQIMHLNFIAHDFMSLEFKRAFKILITNLVYHKETIQKQYISGVDSHPFNEMILFTKDYADTFNGIVPVRKWKPAHINRPSEIPAHLCIMKEMNG